MCLIWILFIWYTCEGVKCFKPHELFFLFFFLCHNLWSILIKIERKKEIFLTIPEHLRNKLFIEFLSRNFFIIIFDKTFLLLSLKNVTSSWRGKQWNVTSLKTFHLVSLLLLELIFVIPYCFTDINVALHNIISSIFCYLFSLQKVLNSSKFSKSRFCRIYTF